MHWTTLFVHVNTTVFRRELELVKILSTTTSKIRVAKKPVHPCHLFLKDGLNMFYNTNKNEEMFSALVTSQSLIG